MKEQRDKVWEIIFDISSKLVESNNLPQSHLLDISKKVFNEMVECLKEDVLSPKAGAVFLTAFKDCSLTRKDLAQYINDVTPMSKKVTVENIRDLLHDAREQIRMNLEHKLGIRK
jgi:hypothetical protein